MGFLVLERIFGRFIAGQASVYLSRHTYNPNISFGGMVGISLLFMLVCSYLLQAWELSSYFAGLNRYVLSDPLYYDS